MKNRIVALAVGAAAALTVIAPLTAAAATQPAAHPLFTCTSSVTDPEANVSPTVDWLKVHKSASTSSAAVGQLKSGAQFCITRNPSPSSPWIYGYGYNGSTKLTGWVYGPDMIFP